MLRALAALPDGPGCFQHLHRSSQTAVTPLQTPGTHMVQKTCIAKNRSIFKTKTKTKSEL